MAITLRRDKGAPLTNDELDDNFADLSSSRLLPGNNLADVSDVALARENLSVDEAGTAIAMAIALG